MALVKKLTRIGNSTGLVLERALLEALNLDPKGGSVAITIEGQAIVIRPYPPVEEPRPIRRRAASVPALAVT